MGITEKLFGQTKAGEDVILYTIGNRHGMRVAVATLGGAIQSILFPAKDRTLIDVVLGYDDVAGYEAQDTYIGCLIGRFGNRIAKGRFRINGREYRLYCNNGNNHLHGGRQGFDKKLWQAAVTGENELILTYLSAAGEEGYPGELSVCVRYSLTEENTLRLDYQAQTTQDTLCNLTHHSYFNLAGCNSGDIGEQKIELLADHYTAVDVEAIPHGAIMPVANTPLDFRVAKQFKTGWDDDFATIKDVGGYDHNFVIPEYNGALKKFAKAYSAQTGIRLTAATTLPGFQLYSGNFLNGQCLGKNNVPIIKRSGFCLESQYFPNAINVPSFIQPILRAGDVYQSTTTYQFSTAIAEK